MLNLSNKVKYGPPPLPWKLSSYATDVNICIQFSLKHFPAQIGIEKSCHRIDKDLKSYVLVEDRRTTGN